jgi:hypothetical protein
VSLLSRLASLLMLPATALHETTHVLAATPWAREIRVRFVPGAGGAEATIVYDPAVPGWLRRLHALAPFVIGLVGAVIFAAWWWMTGTPMPQTLHGQVGALYLVYSWALYAVVSSGSDLRGGGDG